MQRRKFVAGVATGIGMATAGCIGGGGVKGQVNNNASTSLTTEIVSKGVQDTALGKQYIVQLNVTNQANTTLEPYIEGTAYNSDGEKIGYINSKFADTAIEPSASDTFGINFPGANPDDIASFEINIGLPGSASDGTATETGSTLLTRPKGERGLVVRVDDQIGEIGDSTNHGATRVSDAHRGDYAFSVNRASAEYIDSGYTPPNNANISIIGWFKVPSSEVTHNDVRDIVGMHDGGQSGDYQGEGMGIRHKQDGTVRFYKFHPSNDEKMHVESTSSFTGDDWMHIAGVVDNSDGVGRLYINSQLEGSATNISLTPEQNPNFGFGCQIKREGGTTIPQVFWTGAMDDVRIYNRALSIGEIKAIYKDSN